MARSMIGRHLVSIVLVSALSSGCLVVSLQPVYDDRSIVWDEALLGRWRDGEDNVEVTVERGEWRSYRVRYKHPVEERVFTGHLTAIGDVYYLDLMAPRGEDHGPVLIPSHFIVRLLRDGERWQVSAIDYDSARAALKQGSLRGAPAAIDQKHNLVLTGSTDVVRRWLRARPPAEFSAPAIFEREMK